MRRPHPYKSGHRIRVTEPNNGWYGYVGEIAAVGTIAIRMVDDQGTLFLVHVDDVAFADVTIEEDPIP